MDVFPEPLPNDRHASVNQVTSYEQRNLRRAYDEVHLPVLEIKLAVDAKAECTL